MSDKSYKLFIALIVILGVVWLACIIGIFWIKVNGSCDQFSNTALKDVPARCVKEYQK